MVDNDPIDFVITWVDGNDPKWVKDKEKFTPRNKHMNKKDKFRDWDNLQYMFRSFEKFTPWVNKIYFITYGHIPYWLNTNHPKLVIVKHENYMEKENLPVFNICPIEINIHKIKGLSEKFVFFNDDTFIIKPVNKETFFKNNLPVNVCISDIMHEGELAHIVVNNIDIINKYHNRHISNKHKKRSIILNNFWKWFSPKYGFNSIKTLLLMYWSPFTGFISYHHPQPFLKQTFIDVWELEKEKLEKVSKSKFRDDSDVNQYLFKYWQFVKGRFYPDNYKNAYEKRKYVNMRSMDDVKNAAEDIKSGKFEMYCPNDTLEKSRYTKKSVTDEEFEECKKILANAFETILPNKSEFER